MEEVNKVCNEIVEKYDDYQLFEENTDEQQIKTKKNELEQLCCALLSSILSNILALHEDQVKKLRNKLEKYLVG